MTLLFMGLYWAVALCGLALRRQTVLLYLFFATIPLGSFAILPPNLVGGLSLLGPQMTVILIAVKEFVLSPSGPSRLTGYALQTRQGPILAAYWCVAALVTVFAPRMLTRDIEVIPMSAPSLGPTPLAPTVQNVSQLAYLTVSVLGVLAFASIFQDLQERRHVIRALLLSGVVTVVSGIADLFSSMPIIGTVLSSFRTAQYRLLDDSSLADGSKRIVGMMPEASAFGALTISLFTIIYFLRYTIEEPVLRSRANKILIALAVMAVLSTSSAGYVAIGVISILLFVDWFSRTAGTSRHYMTTFGTTRQLLIFLNVLSLLVVVLIVAPSVIEPVLERFKTLVLEKPQTSSFDERSQWTAVSLVAGLESNLLGVGLGSTRASNYVVSVFASTGLVGLVLYFAFVVRLFRDSNEIGSVVDRITIRSLRWSYLPVFSMEILVGTTPNFGVFNAMRWGLLMALLAPVGRNPELASNQTELQVAVDDAGRPLDAVRVSPENSHVEMVK